MNTHMISKAWEEIIFLFINFNGCEIEVREWTSYLIPHFLMDVTTYILPTFYKGPCLVIPLSTEEFGGGVRVILFIVHHFSTSRLHSYLPPFMMSSNGNIFSVTGPSWGESGDRWIPLTKASDAELWCAWTKGWANNRDAGDFVKVLVYQYHGFMTQGLKW